MASYSYTRCCVHGCTFDSKESKEGVLHTFPHPTNDKERYQKWVRNIGKTVADLEDTYVYNNRRVCRKHFETAFHYPKNRLCRLAVPTLFMPTDTVHQKSNNHDSKHHENEHHENDHHENDHHESDHHESDHHENEHYESNQTFTQQTATVSPLIEIISINPKDAENIAHNKQVKKIIINVDCNKTRPVEVHPVKIMPDAENIAHDKQVNQIKNNVDCDKTRPVEVYPVKIIPGQNKMSMKEVKLNKSILKLKSKLGRNKNNIIIEEFDIIINRFAKACTARAEKKKTGTGFTINEKILALSLYKASPKEYQLLSETCTLPKIKTLQTVLHSCQNIIDFFGPVV